MANRRPRPVLIALTLVLHVVVTALVWRDIRRRSPAQLRGGKALWRTLSAANTGNSVVYLVLGRRRSHSSR